jgi:hypothetical protein
VPKDVIHEPVDLRRRIAVVLDQVLNTDLETLVFGEFWQ